MKSNGTPRARRPFEREYLATLNAAVPLDTWQAICKRAADDAWGSDPRGTESGTVGDDRLSWDRDLQFLVKH